MPRKPENLTPVIGPLSLQIIGAEHLVDDSGREYLSLSEQVGYPEEPSNPLSTILLREYEQEEGRLLGLPTDYMMLGTALNEGLSQHSERGQKFLEDVFDNMGHMLRRVMLSGQGLPASLDFNQVLLDREQFGIKLLPPVIMVSERNLIEDAAQKLVASLRDSISAEAPNTLRAEQALGFVGVFEGALQR